MLLVNDEVRGRVDWLRECGLTNRQITAARLNRPMSEDAFKLLASQVFASKRKRAETKRKTSEENHE